MPLVHYSIVVYFVSYLTWYDNCFFLFFLNTYIVLCTFIQSSFWKVPGLYIHRKRALQRLSHPFSAMQDLNESLAELNVEGGVYDGVHRTVDVAQPGESSVEFCGNVAVCVHYVRDEEWQPAYDENTLNGKK